MNKKNDLERLVQERTRELKQAHGFLDSIIENIPDMVFIKDARDLKFVRFNKAGEELLGYPREAMLGKSDYDFFPKHEADFFTAMDRDVLAGHVVLDIPEEPIHTRLKGNRILHTKKIPIRDDQGAPVYLLGISEDITVKKQTEEAQNQLNQAQIARAEAEKGMRLRDDFISIASHELKTPLTALKMQFQIIPRVLVNVSFPEKEQFFSLVQSSLRQLDQFSRLVDELLDNSQIDAGTLTIEMQHVTLSELIHQVLEQYQSELRSAGCLVSTKLDAAIHGYWDPSRIKQIVANLLSNAMKYGAGRPIEIATQLAGSRAVLTVHDHGIGIAKGDQAKIFARFARVAPVTKFRGLGLGLFILREIVLAHGGTIRVESELGKGSTFIVDLPLQAHLS